MLERRKFVRSNGLVLVNYKIPELGLEGKSSAYDIGGSGVRITLDRKLKPAALVEMEIYLPGDSRPIAVKGEVVWVENCKEQARSALEPRKEYFYAGIKFTVIDENNSARIGAYVERKLRWQGNVSNK